MLPLAVDVVAEAVGTRLKRVEGFAPNPGLNITAQQLAVFVFHGAPFDLTWRAGGSEQMRGIAPGHVNITPPGEPLYLKWGTAEPCAHIIAIGKPLVTRILIGAGISPQASVIPEFGIEDVVIRQLTDACESEVTTQGASGRLYAEGLAMALVTHLYRTHGDARLENNLKGGLTLRDQNIVRDYIEANLQNDIGLEDLAALVNLSPHYFSEAFRQSFGTPPYRYVLQRRVERAKALLLEGNLSTAKIAIAVGFSSQAQLTVNFRRLAGTTPGRFRREGRL